MVITSQWRRIVVGVAVLLSFFLGQYVQAEEVCGDIIRMEDDFLDSEPIQDCEFPFGPINTNESLSINFNDTQIEDGGVYPIAGSFGFLDIQDITFFSFVSLFKHQDDDYLLVTSNGQSFTFDTGTYSLYVSEMDVPVLSQGIPQRLIGYLFPVAHAAAGNSTLITFTITEPVPIEPEVDPLILKYAPILYFHPEEDYYPMDVGTFIEASSLWEISPDGDDTLVKSSSDLTSSAFESIINTGTNTDDMYLAFSSPDTPRVIDLQRAKSAYTAMDMQSPTVYYHKMTDTTDYGKTFTVLQYWYFYAMNNWGEKDGYNNHEGDWESTFVFLNENEEPEYVAYSSHLNDQYAFNSFFQYDSVRRNWNNSEVERIGDNVKNYVALGSHANYSNFDKNSYFVPSPKITAFDKVSDSGDILPVHLSSLIDILSQDWFQYTGIFGTFTDQEGFNGPQGPTHINVTGQTRFSEPIEWAGLNNFFKKVVNEATDTVEDTKQGIKMVFGTALDAGVEVTVQLHNEMITFGNNVLLLNPIPMFWDITSSLEGDTFSTILILSYSDEAVEAVGGNEEDIVVVHYNPETSTLEALDSTVDTVANTVSATTTHFSRFLLGFQEAQVVEDVEEPEVVTTPIQAEPSHGSRVRRPEAKVLGMSTTTIQEQVEQLRKLVEIATVLSIRKEEMSEQQMDLLRGVLMEVQKLFKSI